jgi:hypothetical protein
MNYVLADNNELAAACENECERVNRWREETLALAGWTPGRAPTIAERADIDLRRACDLLDNGCDQYTAWRIVR